jgi:hypothetical protein
MPVGAQRIARLRLWHVPLTSHATYYMAEGKTCDTVETVVIALETDTGLTGWGEVCPIPHYLPAYARGVAPALQELAPVILGADPVGARGVMAPPMRMAARSCYAKSALDIALWDLTGQAAGLPLHALLGGRGRPTCRSTTRSPASSPTRWRASPARLRPSGITSSRPSSAPIGRLADRCRAPAPACARRSGPARWSMATGIAARPRSTPSGSAGRGGLRRDAGTALRDAGGLRPRARATGLPMKLDELAHDTASLLEAHRLGSWMPSR